SAQDNCKQRKDRKWPKHADARKDDTCARKPPSITLYRMSLSRRRLMRNTLVVAPPLPPAYRSRIRFARNGTLARVAFPLFAAWDDERLAITQATAGSRCGGEWRRRRRDRHRRLRDNRLLVGEAGPPGRAFAGR